MNAKRKEDMDDVLPRRRILMRHGKSQENRDTTTFITTPDHIIQSTVQGMTQALCVVEHLRCVMDMTAAPETGGCSFFNIEHKILTIVKLEMCGVQGTRYELAEKFF